MKKIAMLGLLCALLLCGIAAAEEPFVFDPESGTITAYQGREETVKVPQAIGGIPVRALGPGVFDQNKELREIWLPEGLSHIQYNAFYFCENLQAVHLPGSLQSIDSYAFFSCGQLTSIELPSALAFIDEQAFAFCSSLEELRFSGRVPYIASNAFLQGPENRRFLVPAQEQDAYQRMLNTACIPAGDVQELAADSQVLFDAASGSITGYEGYSADVLVPASIGGVAVTAIQERAFFANPWIRRVSLSDGITHIGKEAFFGSKLGTIALPDSLTSIAEAAFASTRLSTLILPQNLLHIGPSAFSYGLYKDVQLPSGINSIPEAAFAHCINLETLVLPEGLMDIQDRAFAGCGSLHYLAFEGSTPPRMAMDAFLDCKAIQDIDIRWDADRASAENFRQAFLALGLPGDQFNVWRANPPEEPPYPMDATFTFDEDSQLVTSYQGNVDSMTMFWSFWKQDGSATLPIKGLGAGVFEGSSLRHFSVPHSEAFETIGDRAFAGSALESIYLFDSVTEIGREAFLNCVNLKQLVLPGSIKHIGEGAFMGCDALERLILPADVSIAGDLGLPPERIFIEKEASEEQVKRLASALNLPWYMDLLREGEESSFVPMPESLIPNPGDEFTFDAKTGAITAYTGSSSLVVVPREIDGVQVRSIQYPGFSNLTVYSVAMGSQDNTSLKQVILPDTLREIADSAFLNCTALERVDCYGPVDQVGIRAFEECKALVEVVFHNGVRELGIYCFNQCESLKKVELGNKIQRLPEGVFWGCGFEELVLKVPLIDAWAFKDCAKVRSILVMPTVNSLGEGVFQGMGGLKQVRFEGADPDILGQGLNQFDFTAIGLIISLPLDTAPETKARFVALLNQNMLPGQDMVVLETLSAP